MRRLYPIVNLGLFVLATTLLFSACEKSDDNQHVTIHYTGDLTAGNSIQFYTDKKLTDISWHFGDGDSNISTLDKPLHLFKKKGSYNITIAGTYKKSTVSGQSFLYVTDSGTLIARKYKENISRTRNWHHVYQFYSNGGVPPNQTINLNDTAFAYKMANDSTISTAVYRSYTIGNTVYYESQYTHPYEFSFSYNPATDQISFTKGSSGLGGGSSNTYTSY